MLSFMALKALPWKLVGYAALGLALASALVALKLERTTNAKLTAQIEKCAEARKADQSAYRAAQEQSRANNLAHVRKVESEQRAANDETVRNLNTRLELLRRELRAKAPGANQGAAGGSSVPEAGSEPGASEEARVCLAPEEFLRAAENEERHDQLITLIEKLIAR